MSNRRRIVATLPIVVLALVLIYVSPGVRPTGPTEAVPVEVQRLHDQYQRILDDPHWQRCRSPLERQNFDGIRNNAANELTKLKTRYPQLGRGE